MQSVKADPGNGAAGMSSLLFIFLERYTGELMAGET